MAVASAAVSLVLHAAGCERSVAPASNAALRPTRLRIALASPPYSLDPHASNESAAFAVNSNIYETLVETDSDLAIQPALARRWFSADDVTWNFDLVRGARFSDGTPLEAADVVWSLLRAKSDVISEWRGSLARIASVEAPAPDRVVVHTREPFPTLLANLVPIAIVPRGRGADLATTPIGSGPYRLRSRDPRSGAIELAAWEGHRGGAPLLREVSFVAIRDEAARAAALRGGSVDMIADVPVAALAEFGRTRGLQLLRTAGLRELFLAFDTARTHMPQVAAVNPFRDRRVRLAVRQAIDVAAINREVMGGLAEPATQFAAPRVFGFSPRIVAPAFDPERARALLTAAGYRAGFSVVLDAPSGLYPMDAAIAGRVAAALLPLGIRVRVELLDKQALFDKLGRRESSFYMLSWNCLTADMQEILDYLLHSPDPAHGYGGENAGGYSNPELDRLGEQAARTMNPVERGALLAQAVELAHQDTPWVPVYVQSIVYGLRTPFQWRPRPDKRIRVSDVTLAD